MKIHAVDKDFEVIPGLTICRNARVQFIDYRGYDVDAMLTVTEAGKPEIRSLTVLQRDGGPRSPVPHCAQSRSNPWSASS
ncbi:hypothetical protein FXW78_55040 [Rhodococcus opacus]|nr:hypothetical protein [Rhodococcus opacus]